MYMVGITIHRIKPDTFFIRIILDMLKYLFSDFLMQKRFPVFGRENHMNPYSDPTHIVVFYAAKADFVFVLCNRQLKLTGI